MQRVLVVDKSREPLMPCHPARARNLLKAGKAAVLRREPFTIVLKERKGGNTQSVRCKVDPGSKVSGLALVAETGQGYRMIWAAELHHRGERIKKALSDRRALRRARRTRKVRYRKPRFSNRGSEKSWLAPSLRSRVENVATWVGRLSRFAPVCSLSIEVAKFDSQKLMNPEIS